MGRPSLTRKYSVRRRDQIFKPMKSNNFQKGTVEKDEKMRDGIILPEQRKKIVYLSDHFITIQPLIYRLH